MAAIVRLLLLLVLCAPWGASAQEAPAYWIDYRYNSDSVQEVRPVNTAAGLYQVALTRPDIVALRRSGSPAIRSVYENPENFLAALRQKYQSAFESPGTVQAVNFVRMIPLHNGQPGLVLPNEADITSRVIQVSGTRGGVRAPVVVARPSDEGPTLRSALEQIQELRNQLNLLRNSGVSSNRVSVLERSLGSLTSTLDTLTRAQAELTTASGVRHTELSAVVAGQQSTLTQLLADVRSLQSRPDQISTESGAPYWLLYAGVIALLGLLLLFGGWSFHNTRRANTAHGRVAKVEEGLTEVVRVTDRVTDGLKDVMEKTDNHEVRLTLQESSVRFDPTLVSQSAIAALENGKSITVPVTLPNGEKENVVVERKDMTLILSPLRRNVNSPGEKVVYPLATNVASTIAKAGREGRIGNAAPPAAMQKQVAA